MSRVATVVLAAILGLSACSDEASPLSALRPAGASPDEVPVHKIKNQYIVVFKDDVQDVPAYAQHLAEAYHGLILHTYDSALHGFAVTMNEAAAQALARNPNIALIEQDQEVTASDIQTNAPWALDRSDQRDLPLNGTYASDASGAGVNVYVIDSGIRFDHTQFGGRAVSGFDAIDGGDADDGDGHGTHVAGSVGGSTYGIAKGVNLIAVRVLDDNGNGTLASALAGIDWVTANHVKPAVANMSLGGPASMTLDDAVRNSIAAGVTYVVAAGNDDQNACFYSPARVGDAITVGAASSSDARASFSNYGVCLDLFGPGVNVLSAWRTSTTALVTLSGTSMAAPHVAGVAALLLENNPTATPAIVASSILSLATTGKVTGLGSGSPNRLLYSVVDTTPAQPPVAVVNGPYDGNEGAVITFSSTGSNNPGNGPLIYTWRFGDGTMSPLANPTKVYTDNGTFTVSLKVESATGHQDTATTTATIANVNPTGSLTAPGSINEGTGFTLKLTANDVSVVDKDQLQMWLDCGQGAGDEGPFTSLSKTITCPIAADQDTLTVKGTIHDKDGGLREITALVKVKNVVPVTTLAATSATSIPKNGSVSFDGLFTDGGVNDNPWTWTMTWGDGVKTSGLSGTQNTVMPLTHLYAKAGTFSAQLQVKDKDGKTGSSAKITITVSP